MALISCPFLDKGAKVIYDLIRYSKLLCVLVMASV
ncbi:MAG: hypothetical protein ACI89D_002064 [Bermanella sp.]|jgi:hypothetical protein